MRGNKLILVLLFLLSAAGASAQFTISKVKPSKLDPMAKDSIKQTSMSNDFFNRSKWEAERRKIRKERNFIEFAPSLQISQTQFDNWASGGDNTFSGRSTVFFRHEYKREKLTVDYRFEARYGINLIDSKVFKNEDEFKIRFFTSWNIKHNWSYAAEANLRSQFSKGYKSRNDETLISNFMAPGFVDVSVGFKYRRKDSPFGLTLSPIAGSMTTVLYEPLSEMGINGVEKGKKSKQTLGPSIRAEFDKQFCKNIFRYRAMIYSFTDLKTTPTVRWDNTFEIRATKFLTTTFTGTAFYDKYANTPNARKLQLNYSIAVGLSYKLTNK